MRYVIKLFAAFLCALAFGAPGYAAEVDERLARVVSENFLDYVVQEFDVWSGESPTVNWIKPVRHQGVQVFWLVDVLPSGFLLISSRDELSPVKLYSDQDGFDPSRINNPAAPESWIIPEQYFSVTGVVQGLEQDMIQAESSVVQKIDRAWDLFGRTVESQEWREFEARTAEVGPIITAKWAQGDPYNRQTPDISGEQTLVGCVATAWSMLLRHWQWPDRGQGTKSHTWNGQTFTIDFSEQSWDWESMPDELTGQSSASQIDAVAKLGFQVGVAAEMNWGVDESGSDLYADEVLHVYFKYKDTMEQVARAETSAQTWFNYYETEFDAAPPRPIVMSIFGDGGGHEILADGYQTGVQDMVHLNLGWGGFANTWYDVTSDFVTGGYTWDAMRTVIVTGIEPQSEAIQSIPTMSEWGMIILTGILLIAGARVLRKRNKSMLHTI